MSGFQTPHSLAFIVNTPIPIIVPAPARIRSWQDLRTAAEELHSDSTDHGYRAFRSSGRRYSANVKVHSYGDLDKAIEKLGEIPDAAVDAIKEEFSDNATNDLFNDWIRDEAESLKEWFKGEQHSPPDYYKNLASKVSAGEDTAYPALRDLPSIPARLKEIAKWRDESALFLDASKAADDGDSITWEGSSGGYVTWDARYDIEDASDDIIGHCDDALDPDIGASTRFTDALREFRDIERTHALNIMLIDYLEAWAQRMEFQPELDFRVSDFYQQNEDEYAGPLSIFEEHATLPVIFADSLAAGNCQSGTAHWAAAHFPGRTSATVAEILTIQDSRPLARRACRQAIHRHLHAA